MLIGIVDADLLGRENHRFPNLVCEKLSSYWKERGATVNLILDKEYSWLLYDRMALDNLNCPHYDRIYVSKVFTDTWVPEQLLQVALAQGHGKVGDTDIFIGGTGFYFDKAPNLPDDIEHHMPDYHLYDDWIASELEKAKKQAEAKGKIFKEAVFTQQFKEYTDYSIGFLTRGCFRKCEFCVNKKYNHVFQHSPLSEFYDPSRKKICLLDDNFFGCAQWKPLLQELIDTGKQFKFKQGMDERIMTEEKCEMLFHANYDGDYTFAFDNIADYDLIKGKLELIHKYIISRPRNLKVSVKFYVLVGFESTDAEDIQNAFKRIELLMKYGCLPYIMRYQNKNYSPWKDSRYRGMYITLARWANQPSMIKKMSFRQYCEANQLRIKTVDHLAAPMQALIMFERENPEIAARYFDLRFDQLHDQGGAHHEQ